MQNALISPNQLHSWIFPQEENRYSFHSRKTMTKNNSKNNPKEFGVLSFNWSGYLFASFELVNIQPFLTGHRVVVTANQLYNLFRRAPFLSHHRTRSTSDKPEQGWHPLP